MALPSPRWSPAPSPAYRASTPGSDPPAPLLRAGEHLDERDPRFRREGIPFRIARELPDAVGHHVALINLQGGALACLLDDEDRSAGQGVARAHTSSRPARKPLRDLRLTAGLLCEPAEPAEPVPGLDQLEELICSFARAGPKVTPEVTGQARPLLEAVELTAATGIVAGMCPL